MTERYDGFHDIPLEDEPQPGKGGSKPGGGKPKAEGEAKGQTNGEAKGKRKPPDPACTVENLTITAEDLDAEIIAAVKFVIQDLLTRGLTIYAGPPKVGKSWLAGAAADAVTAGLPFCGVKPTDQGEVLVLDLESNKRRGQTRLRAIRQGRKPKPGMLIAYQWPRMDEGGLELIGKWAKARPGKARLVVIDVWNRFRPRLPRGADPYQHDADSLAQLHAVAIEYDIAILVLHHTRKTSDADWAAEVSGTQGITGTADTIWVMKRVRGSKAAVLHVTGRDVDEVELGMEFDPSTGLWSILGDAIEVAMGRTRNAIHACLCHATAKGMTPKDIAEETDIPAGTVRKALKRMLEAGTVLNEHGRYSVPAGHLA